MSKFLLSSRASSMPRAWGSSGLKKGFADVSWAFFKTAPGALRTETTRGQRILSKEAPL